MNTKAQKIDDDQTSRVYVACLASYNAGVLHGRWIDVDGMDEEDIGEEIEKVFKTSPAEGAEEYAIHDYDGPLGPLASWLGEHPDLETLCAIVDAFGDHEPGAVRAFIGWDGSWDRERFEESYQGEWDSFEDFAEHLADETIEGLRDCESLLARYFDYDAFARDLRYDYYEVDGHVFYCV